EARGQTKHVSAFVGRDERVPTTRLVLVQVAEERHARLQIREPPGPRDQEAGVGNPLPHRPECAQEEVPPLSLELSTDEQDRGGVCCGARATDGWRPVLGEIRARENG